MQWLISIRAEYLASKRQGCLQVQRKCPSFTNVFFKFILDFLNRCDQVALSVLQSSTNTMERKKLHNQRHL